MPLSTFQLRNPSTHSTDTAKFAEYRHCRRPLHPVYTSSQLRPRTCLVFWPRSVLLHSTRPLRAVAVSASNFSAASSTLAPDTSSAGAVANFEVQKAGLTRLAIAAIREGNRHQDSLAEGSSGTAQSVWDSKAQNSNSGPSTVTASKPSEAAVDKFERQLDERELLRRQRISRANRGKRPWNYGRKHSEETKRKIRERTLEAMQRPQVVEKLRANHYPKRHTQETKTKIRRSLLTYRALEKEMVQQLVETQGGALAAAAGLVDDPSRGVEVLSPHITDSLARLSPLALDKEVLGQNASAKKLTEHFSLARIQRIVATAQRVLEGSEAEADSSGDEEQTARNGVVGLTSAAPSNAEQDTAGPDLQAAAPQNGFAISTRDAAKEEAERQAFKKRFQADSHRAKIAAAIRRKWEDPEYRARVAAGYRKPANQPEAVAKRRRRAPEREAPKVEAVKAPRSPAAKAPKPKAATEKPKQTVAKAASTAPKKPKGTTKQNQARSKEVTQPQPLVAAKVYRKQDAKAAKLQIAERLVDEMEVALAQFADLDMREENSDLRQSVEEAKELLLRARAQVDRLTKGQPRAASQIEPTWEQGSSDGVQSAAPAQGAMNSDELDSAMLVLNMD